MVKKHCRKNLGPIFGKVIASDKKKLWTNFEKVYVGKEKTTLDQFLKEVMQPMKKKQKKHGRSNVFLSPKIDMFLCKLASL